MYLTKKNVLIVITQNLHINIHNSFIHDSRKLLTQMFISWSINCDTDTMEYYSTLKMKKLLLHVVTWMDLKALLYMNESNHERLYTVWFHVCDSLAKTKL